MRPLRLSITAFGPYAGTEIVDFDALTDLGLFVVAGNNGAGKTTIFDALHYSLFGTLPGRRASYVRLKSDHADKTIECSVTFDFLAHGKHWRVERSPKQDRPKKRGNGFTTVDRRATLFQLEHGFSGPATAVANKIGQVDDKCRELVGLSGKQFERVALLPQGEFSRVLRESGTERRDLLRTLFSSELFGDATKMLDTQANEATAADRSVLDRLDHQQAAIADSLATLAGRPVTGTAAELQATIGDLRRVQLAELQRQASELEQTASQATANHQSALVLHQRLGQRERVEQEHRAHQQGVAQHEADVERLERARAAVPVVSLVRTATEQEQRHDHGAQQVHELQQRLNRALQTVGIATIDETHAAALDQTTNAVATLAQLLHDRTQAASRASDLHDAANQAAGQVRRVVNEVDRLDQQHVVAQTRYRQLRGELDALQRSASLDQREEHLRLVSAQLHQRTELAQIEAEHYELARQATERKALLAQAEQDHLQAQQAKASLAGLQHKADAAFANFNACTERVTAATTYAQAVAKLDAARAQDRAARDRSEQLWNAFIAGTAARVAEALVDQEPCPVCGSAEHPEPAVVEPGDTIVTQAEVDQARTQAEVAQTRVRSIETEIEKLRSVHHDIASLSPAELAAESSTAKAMALGARTVADQAHSLASQLEGLVAKHQQLVQEHQHVDATLRALDERCHHLRGALGPTANDTVASLQQQTTAAELAHTIAATRSTRLAELTEQLTLATNDIDAIELEQVAAESRRSAAASQLDERQQALATATAQVTSIEQTVAAASQAHCSEPFERRTQAARHATDLLVELGRAVAVQHDAAQGLRRARSLLNDRISQSRFASADAAVAAHVDADIVAQLESQTASFAAASERIGGQLVALSDLPDQAPDLTALHADAERHAQAFSSANRSAITLADALDRLDGELAALVQERTSRQTGDTETRRLERVAALVKGDNDRNTSLENWVLAAHLRDVVELANVRLAQSTHQRFQLCVLDDGENRRGKWGLDLGVEDTVTGTRRPTAGLSGGELFQASLALALGLADAVMNQTAGVRVDALFIDEGFGSLDEVSVERAIDLLDELRDRGAMVGVITHVPALLDALPLGVRVVDAPNGQGSTIQQARLAA